MGLEKPTSVPSLETIDLTHFVGEKISHLLQGDIIFICGDLPFPKTSMKLRSQEIEAIKSTLPEKGKFYKIRNLLYDIDDTAIVAYQIQEISKPILVNGKILPIKKTLWTEVKNAFSQNFRIIKKSDLENFCAKKVN